MHRATTTAVQIDAAVPKIMDIPSCNGFVTKGNSSTDGQLILLLALMPMELV
jgi:hypothetical protein